MTDPQLTQDDTGPGGKPGILLLLHKVMPWSQEGPHCPGGQSTAFIAGPEPRFQGEVGTDRHSYANGSSMNKS